MLAVETKPAAIDNAPKPDGQGDPSIVDDAVPQPETQCIAERIIVATVCIPLSLLFGWFFFTVLVRGINMSRNWLSVFAELMITAFVATLFLLFALASAAAITGRDRFDQILFRWLLRLALVSVIFVAIVILIAVI